MERCESCGFAWELIGREECAERSAAGAAATAELLRRGATDATRRPTPERWSAVEYAAHVRDVFLTIRDRLVLGLVEENPGFKPLYREERIDRGLYRSDTAAAVAPEVIAAAAMFGRLFDAIDPKDLQRPVQYGWPDPQQRTLLWMGQQAVHEVEHHLADIAENLATIAPPGPPGSDGPA